jgi:predicted phage gp36 major capsid-like protein
VDRRERGVHASDEAFGPATLNAYKAGTLMKVSEELLQDSAFDLEAYIRGEFGNRIGVLENTAYVAGDGSGKPTGSPHRPRPASPRPAPPRSPRTSSSTCTTRSAAAVPPERKLAAEGLDDQARPQAHRTTSASTCGSRACRPAPRTRCSAGRSTPTPTWPPPRPASCRRCSATSTTTWIRDVDGVAFQRLNELYAENGQVGFRAYHRTDGKLMNTAAIKKLTQA